MIQPFKFKEFTVEQDKVAMKIVTDGVLLGAWCTVDKYPDTILDVGAGSGVVALMIAERSNAMTIHAVEVDENAYEQSICIVTFSFLKLYCSFKETQGLQTYEINGYKTTPTNAPNTI
jgi:tRNA1(Val) A37 N6-methylase TrmN6